MFQLRKKRIPRPSRTQIVFGSLSAGIVIVGIIVAVAFSIVEKIIHPKKKTPFDLYTVSPFELNIPAETVAFPPLCGDYHVNGWYLSHPEVTTTILVCPGFHTRAADVLAIRGPSVESGS